MLQLPCLRVGLKGGNGNIIQLKSLCSAVYVLPSVCSMQTDFTFWSAVCWPNKKSSVKWAYLHCKTVINPNAYRYQEWKIRKKDYQVAHLLIFSRNYTHSCVNLISWCSTSNFLAFFVNYLSYTCCLSSDMFQISDTYFRGKIAWNVKPWPNGLASSRK